jgi:hypothetical protein
MTLKELGISLPRHPVSARGAGYPVNYSVLYCTPQRCSAVPRAYRICLPARNPIPCASCRTAEWLACGPSLPSQSFAPAALPDENTCCAIAEGWAPSLAPLPPIPSSNNPQRRPTIPPRRCYTASRARSLYGEVKSARRLRNQFLADGYNFSNRTVERGFSHMGNGPVAVFGFTCTLEFVAWRALETEGRFTPELFARRGTGRNIVSEQSELFRQVFKVPLFNRYGGRELSAMACQFAEGRPLHVLRPWLFLEILNDRSRPAAPG